MSAVTDGNAIYSEVSDGAGAKFTMETNACYAGIKSASNATKSKYSWKKRRFLLLFLLVLMSLLLTVAACITLGAEISKLKSELSKQSQNYSALVDKIQQLTSTSLENETRNVTNDSSIQEYESSINVSHERNFTMTVISCSALPVLSPSGYYWVTVSNGSAVHVYCDMTRSCGGVTGGWMRVAYLYITASNQRCPMQ